MMARALDPHHFDRQARRIRAQVSTLLTRSALLPRFNRWRLTQDPASRMALLFGILNGRHIATHTSIPLSDYFDPHLLHDLAGELQVPVVSCSTDGLRYAFILDPGQLRIVPTQIDFPYTDNGNISGYVVCTDNPQSRAGRPAEIEGFDKRKLVSQAVRTCLEIFEILELRNGGASQLFAQYAPEIALRDEDEFNEPISEHEADPWSR